MKKTIITSVLAMALIIPFACKKKKTTYNTDIQPIMANKCTSCHNTGLTSPNLATYGNVKTHIADILDRMNKSESAPGYMPQGTAKSQADIDKINQWQSDGLLEK